MSDENWEKATDLFHEALRMDSGQRSAFLIRECEGNVALQEEVESLIRAASESTSFLEAPVVGELIKAKPEWQFENGSRVAHYNIIEPIGAGGMGEVYLADDERLGRRVALKVLTEDTLRDKNRLQRFEREATTVSALNHPNILTIYDFQLKDDLYFFASEFVQGITLRQKMDEGRLSVIETLEIAIQIASALQAAHNAGVVHRDIKPENVMLREDGYVKVLDFGLAKVSEKTIAGQAERTLIQNFSLPGMIMGTVTYMSPEQARGGRVDSRSDIFSLGIVIYEMLAGETPFAGESTTDILAKIVQNEPQPVARFRRDVPADIESIISKTLMKNAAERHQNVSDLLTDLKAALKRIEFSVEMERAGNPSRLTTLISAEPAAVGPTDLSRSYLSGDLSPLVGREKEVGELADLLTDGSYRLVTLTGIGGTGKTRLAQEMCLRLENEFADGFIFIRLSEVRDASLVPTIIAQQARIQEIVGTPIEDTIRTFFENKHSLLVLDNFEQVLDAAPFVTELLSAAKRIRVLVTSRERLHLQSEVEYNVPPLPVPECDETTSLEQLAKFDSVQLFVARAQHADPNFQLSEENAPQIAKICLMLDGLPLAIELAAARARVFSPSIIMEKLEASLAFLTGGARDLPERQQTIRATVQWSYDLLNDDEKRLLRRLSVFASRFTPSTAEAVVSDLHKSDGSKSLSTTESVEFLDLFSSLADKNLLVRRRAQNGEVSFRLLEIVREYAQSVLETDDDADEIRRRHAEFFLALAQKAEPSLLKKESAVWISRLEAEHDNLRAALQWSVKNDPQIAARLAASIRQFWSVRGHINEGIGWAQHILGLGVELSPTIEWKLLTLCGNFSQFRGDTAKARGFYERSLDAARREGNKAHVAQAMRGLGAMAYLDLDLDHARSIINEAIEVSREIRDDFGLAAALARLGDISGVAGDRKTAIELTKESLSIFRRVGYLEGISAKLYNLGALFFLEGDLEAAGRCFREAFETTQELNEKINTRLIYDGFAAIATERGDYYHAARLSGAAESLGATIGYFIEPGERLIQDAYLGKLRSALSETEFEAERKAGRNLSDREATELLLRTTTEKEDDVEKQRRAAAVDAVLDTNEGLFTRTPLIIAILIFTLIILVIAALWIFRS